MIKLFERIGNDIKRGENLDLYLTVAVGIVIGILSIVGIAPSTWIPGITLTVLAVLAFSALQNRHHFQESLLHSAEVGRKIRASDFLQLEYHLTDEDFASANKIWISGITLTRTTRNYMNVFSERLVAGAEIRIALTDSTKRALLDEWAIRSVVEGDVTYWRKRFEAILGVIDATASVIDSKGKLEVGHVPFIQAFGLILIDPDKPHGVCYVEIYHHKSLERHATFRVSKNDDPYWFEHYKKQYEIIWGLCQVEQRPKQLLSSD